MKVNKYFLGMFACAALCACSNDDSVLSNDVFTGDEAYINVRLMDTGNAMGRATAGTGDNVFERGDEHTVKTAHFYFYDQNKNLVAQSNDWTGGNSATGDNKNIEFKSNAIVVLKGLTEKNFPTYMVTVLNKPESFTPGNTLDNMINTLSEQNAEGIKTVQTSKESSTTYFVMSTSSYKHANATDGTTTCPYFVTEVKQSNFAESESAAKTTTPVEVYVERLAAKVTLTVNDENFNKNKKTIEEGKRTLYKLNSATIAGEANDGGGEEIYAELKGWKLNATAKHSRMMKNINENWGEQDLGFAWNDANNYRSYWGMSFNYETTATNYSYPTTAANYTANETNIPLNYYSLNDNTLELGNAAYCAENTNSSSVVTSSPSAVTSILLKAIACDKDGKELDLVRYKGLLYTKTQFFNYVLNTLQNSTQGLNAYIKKTDNTYEQIGNEYLTWTNVADGKIKVIIDDEKVNLTTTEVTNKVMLYNKNEGENQYTQITTITDLNKNLETASKDAIAYKGGLMYYNIPIEHLNEKASTDESTPEGKYGVVRNHYYKVTINKLENIGKGIFDPTEVIVPQEDDKYYYVGANINILSWKLVNQNVDL